MEKRVKPLVNPIIKLTESDPRPNMPPKIHPEHKLYILLITYKEGSEPQTFIDCIGRTETYNCAKTYITDGADVFESRVLVEGIAIEKCVNLYAFMKKMEMIYTDDDFSVEDFFVGDPPELVELSLKDNYNEEIPSQVNICYDPGNNIDNEDEEI